MAITIIRNTDGGAPVLSGQAGALIGVLDYCLITTLGWAHPYATAGNVATYRCDATNGGNRLYLRVDDSNAQNSRLVGYETMSDLNTGTGPFPTAAQQSGGLYFYKSSAADSAVRPWVFVSNGKLFYLFQKYDATTFGTGVSSRMIAFGDFTSFKQGGGDAYNTIIISEITASVTSSMNCGLVSTLTSPIGGHFIARSYTQTGTAVAANKYSDPTRGASSTIGSGALTYPAPIEGGLIIAPIWLGEGASGASGTRGLLRGLWNPCHAKPLAHGDTYSGTGALAGRTFEVFNLDSSAQIHVETSNTWD